MHVVSLPVVGESNSPLTHCSVILRRAPEPFYFKGGIWTGGKGRVRDGDGDGVSLQRWRILTN